MHIKYNEVGFGETGEIRSTETKVLHLPSKIEYKDVKCKLHIKHEPVAIAIVEWQHI